MTIKFSTNARVDLQKIKKKDVLLYRRVEKQITLFIQNPKHPSLRIHKLTGKLNNSWSLSVTKSHRVVYVFLERNVMYVVGIGTHDHVYKK